MIDLKLYKTQLFHSSQCWNRDFFLEFQSLKVRGTNEFLKMSVFVESYLNCLLCDDLDNDIYQSITNIYRIGGVMVRVLASNAVE